MRYKRKFDYIKQHRTVRTLSYIHITATATFCNFSTQLSTMSRSNISKSRSNISKALAEAIKEHIGEYEVEDIQKIGAAMFEVIFDTLKPGKDVVLTNCIKFHIASIKERTYSNPMNDTKTTKGAHFALRVSVMPATKKRFENMVMVAEANKDTTLVAESDIDSDGVTGVTDVTDVTETVTKVKAAAKPKAKKTTVEASEASEASDASNATASAKKPIVKKTTATTKAVAASKVPLPSDDVAEVDVATTSTTSTTKSKAKKASPVSAPKGKGKAASVPVPEIEELVEETYANIDSADESD
jgi:nucleoid DNA-binding protein